MPSRTPATAPPARRKTWQSGSALLAAGLALLCLAAAWLALASLGASPASASPAVELVWGIEQSCVSAINHPEFALNGPEKGFDAHVAACALSGSQPENAWVMERFSQPSGSPASYQAVEIAFLAPGWLISDTLKLQLSNDGGTNWEDVIEFSAANPPPASLDPMKFSLADKAIAAQAVSQPKVRLFSPTAGGRPEPLMINLDEIALLVSVSPAPSDTPTPTVLAATDTPTEQPSPSDTPTSQPTVANTPIPATATPTGSPEASATPTNDFNPIPTQVSLLVGTVTVTPGEPITNTLPLSTPEARPTRTPAPTPVTPIELHIGPADKQETLWGVQQNCTYSLENSSASLDDLFNNQTASCQGPFAGAQAEWNVSALRHTAFTHLHDAVLQVRLSVSGWKDDVFSLDLYDGQRWYLLQQFGPGLSLPPEALTTLYFNVAQLLNSAEKMNQAAVRLVGVRANGPADHLTISLDGVQIATAGGSAQVQWPGPQPTPASFGPFQINAPLPGEPHSDTSPLTDSCAACHNGHTGVARQLRDGSPEENVCFKCHASAGPGKNVQPAFTNYANTATAYYKHDVSSSSGAHQLSENSAASFSGANRHIECEDCHNPHRSNRNASAAPMIQGEMNNASGVDPTWSGTGAPTGFTWLASAAREFQVCFKCHSSFTSLPVYAPDGWTGAALVANGLRKLTSAVTTQILDSRDMAREFNPSQTSFHPVVALGRNQNIAAASFVNGWTQASMVYCSDCHQNPNSATEGSGPHGSPLLHILNGTSNYSTVMVNNSPVVPNSQVCFTCHNYATYVTGGSSSASHFPLHSYHMNKTWGTTCYTCHDSHGSEQQHLINFDTSVVTPMGARNSQTAWYYDPATGRAGCWLTCHGQGHDPKEYTP